MEDDGPPGVPEWVVTYGDMMSLLLCFFILLSAFSELKKPREYQRVIDSIKEALGLDGGQGLVRTEREFDKLPLTKSPVARGEEPSD